MYEKLTIFALLTISFVNVGAEQSDAAQINAELLDGLCIRNYEDYSLIANQVKALEGIELAAEDIAGDPVLSQVGGRSFAFAYKGSSYIVGFVVGQSCTIVSPNIDEIDLAKLLEERFDAVLIDSDSFGMQVSNLYRVSSTGIHEGAMISLVYSKEYYEGSVGFIAASVVKRALGK